MNTFQEIQVGQTFFCNGNICRKVSTRTALLIEYGRVFYFSKNDVCYITNGEKR